MKWIKYLLGVFIFMMLIISILLYVYRDSIVYVGFVEPRAVDCLKKGELLDSIYVSDPLIRKQLNSGEISLKQFAKEDHENQEIVISILEKCGIPTCGAITDQQMRSLWLVIQHSDKKFRKKYFPFFEKAVKNGCLSKEKYALMKDRMLMDEGKSQIYGSQIKNGKLYKIEDPECVNFRRQNLDMQPLEDYLKGFNITFKVDQKVKGCNLYY